METASNKPGVHFVRPSKSLFEHLSFGVALTFWVVLYVACCVSQPLPTGLHTQSDVIKGVDQAANWREKNLSGYTVRETYSLYRRSDTSPLSEVVVETTYDREYGKTYRVVSESGSTAGKVVLRNILKSERQLSKPENREHILITSENYEMSVPNLQEQELNGRKCLIVYIKARKRSPYLLAGRIWVDSENYHVVRIEGAPTAEPSMWTGHSSLERDYIDVDGFPVAVHARSKSRNALLGETRLEIKYENYHVSNITSAGHRQLH
jgi:hypothetical protein